MLVIISRAEKAPFARTDFNIVRASAWIGPSQALATGYGENGRDSRDGS